MTRHAMEATPAVGSGKHSRRSQTTSGPLRKEANHELSQGLGKPRAAGFGRNESQSRQDADARHLLGRVVASTSG